ncbi:hypothetical protein Echvi_4584 [Echinicola vietnamensis DSM 17526]|uniref:Protein BatD n=2 Tax=Echinicola TaxID=390846 RepID=L0G6X1_ECHVK|nr:hypothetical protein Echvi_4584 [Echinicola vietnamensis DSM 17526]
MKGAVIAPQKDRAALDRNGYGLVLLRSLLVGLWLFSAWVLPVSAQTLWSEVQLNKRTAYVGEPVEVTVRVYTSTWFTKGVDPGNIKVNGAYTVFFRNISTSTSRNGKTFSGVEMIYNVFPFANKDITIPSIDITVESPAEGGYKGNSHVVSTKEQVIKVRPAPPGFDVEGWLVANGLSVRQEWGGKLTDVKVGDVIQRTIIRNADNTVPQLIPPVKWDSLPGVSQYPGRSDIENIRSKTAIGAVRSDMTRYLFEKEGTVEIPEMVFTWWNPYRQQLYKRTLPAVQVEVKPNPNLGMLETLKDSLMAVQQAEVTAEAEKVPLTFLGLSPEQLAIILALVVLLLFFMLKYVPRLVKGYQAKRQAYLRSEPYFFKQFKQAAKGNDGQAVMRALYRWIDRLGLEEPTLAFFAERWGDQDFQDQVSRLSTKSSKDQRLGEHFVDTVSAARKRYFEAARVMPSTAEKSGWINP